LQLWFVRRCSRQFYNGTVSQAQGLQAEMILKSVNKNKKPMYLPHCLNVTHLTISFVLWRLCSVVFIMSSLLCALPHTILPCGNISISCFYITCLLPVLRSFAQWHPAWKVILVILSGMADLNQNIEWSGVGCGKKRVWT
jgi:hypothetical protein